MGEIVEAIGASAQEVIPGQISRLGAKRLCRFQLIRRASNSATRSRCKPDISVMKPSDLRKCDHLAHLRPALQRLWSAISCPAPKQMERDGPNRCPVGKWQRKEGGDVTEDTAQSGGESEIHPIRWGSTSIGGPRHHFRETFMVDMLCRFVKPPAVVVDAGCGSGSLSRRLVARGFRLSSFDLAFDFLPRLNQAVPPDVAPRLSLLSGSAESMPLCDGMADAVVCGEVLEHLPNDGKAIAEMFRILTPGGRALVTVPAFQRLWDVNDEWASHFRRYDKGQLNRLFEDAGFEVEWVRWWGFPFLHAYHRWIYLPWAKRAMMTPSGEGRKTVVGRLGTSAVVSRVLGALFRTERLFSRIPLGIGTMLMARKPVVLLESGTGQVE
jgi:SAM-dependent methyltransferase